jgi:type II secretory pathway component PulJ
LLELLVAVALLGTVLTIIFGAFSQITRGAASVQDRLEEDQQLRRLTGLIADELAAAQFLPELAKAKPKIATGIVAGLENQAGGDFTRIDFHAAVPARFHRQIQPEHDPFLHEIGYRVRQSEDRQHLELARREDYYLDDDLKTSRPGGVEAALVKDVQAFHVEFLAAKVEGQTSTLEEWLDRWDSGERKERDEMPAAMRVTLTLTGKNGRVLTETLDVNLPRNYGAAASGDSSGTTGNEAGNAGDTTSGQGSTSKGQPTGKAKKKGNP